MIPLTVQNLDLKAPSLDTSQNLCKDLKLSFKLNNFIAVVGPNGSGKTTLLKSLAGLIHSEKNTIYLYEKDIHSYLPKERARLIAYHAQNSQLYYDLSVKDLVLLGKTHLQKRFSNWSKDDHQQAEESLKHVKMQDFMNRKCFSLSGGELQRVFLARMLMSEAKILLIDEPTASLDIGKTIHFLTFLKSLTLKGYLVICSMHDLNFVNTFANHVLILSYLTDWKFGITKKILKLEIIEKFFHLREKTLNQSQGLSSL